MRLKDSNKNAISLLHRVIHIAIFIHIHERKTQKECFALIIHPPRLLFDAGRTETKSTPLPSV